MEQIKQLQNFAKTERFVEAPKMSNPKYIPRSSFIILISTLLILLSPACNSATVTVTVPGETHTTTKSTTPTLKGDRFQVVIEKGTFTPATLTIELGDDVTWVNGDTSSHSVVSMHHFQDEDDVTHIFIGEVWDSGYIEPGQSFNRVFLEAGVFEYISLPLIVRTPMEQYSAFSQVGVGVIVVK